MLACPMGFGEAAKGKVEPEVHLTHEQGALDRDDLEVKTNEFYDKEVPNAAKQAPYKPHIYDCKCKICMPYDHAHEYITHRFGQLFDEKFTDKEAEKLRVFRQPDMSVFEGGGAHDDLDDRYEEIDPNKVYPDAKNLAPNTNEELEPGFVPADPE